MRKTLGLIRDVCCDSSRFRLGGSRSDAYSPGVSPVPDSQSELVPTPFTPEEQAAIDAAREAGGDLFDDAHHPSGSQRMLDDLVSRALAYRTGPDLKALFDFTRRFPHMGPYNAMLLHIQNPGIGYALTARAWERHYKRRVKPAVRPCMILWTMGPVAFVFDVGDTEPMDPKDDRVPECVTNPFPAKGQPPPGVLTNLIAACQKIGIKVEVCAFGANLAGQVQQITKRRPKLTAAEQAVKDAAGDLFGEWPDFHIALNSKHTDAQQLGTLAHELGHIFCGHVGTTELGFWTNRTKTDLTVREFEAETVAYFVTDRLNLDIGSAAYLSTYISAGLPLPNYSLDAVLKAAGKIEEMLGGRFRPKRRKSGQTG